MSLEILVETIVGGGLFFARAPNGQYLARYTRYGHIYVWTDRGIQLAPHQGSDLCWHLRAQGENEEN